MSPLYTVLKTQTEEIFQELHQSQLDTSDTNGWSSSSDEVPEKRLRLSLPAKHPKKSPTPVVYAAHPVTAFIVIWNNNLFFFLRKKFLCNSSRVSVKDSPSERRFK